jgi:NAD(P)-dependent dehydrogenase (short-subunit alcohol dehydrogenase family)
VDQFEGAVAVVTGGGSGIGEGLAELCHESGMSVVVSDIEEDAAHRVADGIRARGGRAVAARADVTSREAVEKLADLAFGTFGAVHLLCANAGVLAMAPLLETPEDDFRWMVNVNTFGPFHCAQVFVPRMREHAGQRHILITASMAGLYAGPDLPIGAYTASKYAVVGLAEMLHAELEPEGIGVSILCPGSVSTRIGESKRNRPEEFGGPETWAPRPGGPDVTPRATATARTPPLVLTPRDAARIALDGVRANRLFVPTHANRRPFVQERHRLLTFGFDEIS